MEIVSNNPLQVPTIGTAAVKSSICIVTLICVCKNILMGQMGLPLPCTACNKVWFVSATAKIAVQEVLADVSGKERTINAS